MREPLSKVGIIKHTTVVQCVDSLFIISDTLEKTKLSSHPVGKYRTTINSTCCSAS